MKRSIPANRNRTLQGLSDVGTGWICQFSREEDGQSEKKKNKPCKSTNMLPRSWMPAWSGRKSCCEDFRHPLNFYHVLTSTSQWGQYYFKKSPIRPFLRIHWWCIALYSQLSKVLHQRKQFFFSSFCTGEKWSIERWSDCPASES